MAGPFEQFFRDYALAFDSSDPERVAAFFHRPLLLVGKDGAVSITEDDAIMGYTHGILEHHRANGYARAAVRDIEVTKQAPNLAIVSVHWQVFQADEALLWDWRNTYNLLEEEGGWKILVATTHED